MVGWKQMKTMLILASISFSILITGCDMTNKQSESKTIETQMKDVRETAWSSLSPSEKKEVIGTWKEASITKVIANPQKFYLDDRSYEGKELTVVTFRSKKSKILGDISKLVDEKSQKVLGAGFRE